MNTMKSEPDDTPSGEHDADNLIRTFGSSLPDGFFEKLKADLEDQRQAFLKLKTGKGNHGC